MTSTLGPPDSGDCESHKPYHRSHGTVRLGYEVNQLIQQRLVMSQSATPEELVCEKNFTAPRIDWFGRRIENSVPESV
jgi:hypothetical protein